MIRDMERTTTTDLAELWIAARSYRPQSARQRRSVITRFVAVVGDVPPGELHPRDILRWWTTTEQLSPGTRRSYHAAVRGFLAWCRACGVDAPATMEEIRKPTQPRTVPKVLDVAEELRLRAHVAGGRLELPVLLMLDMGLRRGEVIECRGEDVEAGWLTVRGKGGHVDRIPVAPTVAALMPSVGSVWPWCNNWLAEQTVAAMEVCGIYGRTCHALRRTFCTRKIEQGLSPVDVMRLMRHRSLATMTAYAASQFDRAA